MPRVRLVTSLALAAVAMSFGTAACVPADSRPTLGTAPADAISHEPTGIADVDRVLARLDAVGEQTFTAAYDLRRKLGDLERSASVVQSPPKTVVRIGDVALYTESNPQTCNTATGTCEDGLLEERISDMGISSAFYGPSTAQQLRVAVGRESQPPSVDTAQLGGVAADCLHVSVGGGEETYCVTGDGLLALLDTAAMHIELTSYAPTADQSAFVRPAQPSTVTSS